MKTKKSMLWPVSMIAGAMMMMMTGTLTSCSSSSDDPIAEDLSKIVTGYEIDGHGFMPSGQTKVSGYFDKDSVCESVVMIASQIYTYKFADGHTEIVDRGTFLNYSIDGVGTIYVDSVSYAADSLSLFSPAEFTPKGDTLAYTANVVVKLNQNGAPVKAIAYVAHKEKWATFTWTREEETKSDYWDAPRRFALPKEIMARKQKKQEIVKW